VIGYDSLFILLWGVSVTTTQKVATTPPRIYLDLETKRRLEDIGKKSESFNDIVVRLLNAEFEGVPEDTLQKLEAIATALDMPLNQLNVSHAFLRWWSKVGAVLGFSGDKFFDMGLSQVQKTNVITFFEDEDPTRTRMRLAIGALQGLIKEDGIKELVPHLEAVVEILGEAALEV